MASVVFLLGGILIAFAVAGWSQLTRWWRGFILGLALLALILLFKLRGS